MVKPVKPYSFEIGPIRPPSEGGVDSLLVRFTRNCAWQRCKFCYGSLYQREKFQLRPVEEIERDIDAVKAIAEEIQQASDSNGYSGHVNIGSGLKMLQRDFDLQQRQSWITVFAWLRSGAATAFIQDADSLIMPTPDLVESLRYLKGTFSSLGRITSYARASTIYRKTIEDLMAIKQAGLNRLHVGLESGDDELLKHVDKGVTAEQHIIAGKKAKAAGFVYSTYVMPDLGGRGRSEAHARNTARVLNEIDPNYIRLRPLVPRPSTPLFAEYQSGEFLLSSPHERLRELRSMIGPLTVTSRLCFDHMMNGWRKESGELLFSQDYEGYKLPEEKLEVLELIEQGLRVEEARHIDARDMIAIPHL